MISNIKKKYLNIAILAILKLTKLTHSFVSFLSRLRLDISVRWLLCRYRWVRQ